MRKFCLLACVVSSALFATDSSTYLKGRVPVENGRYKTFSAVLDLMEQREVKMIVETGTERWQEAKNCFDGDGGGTIIFGHWASEHGAQMFSVDINPKHVEYARENTHQFRDNLTIVQGDSVSFLKTFDQEIDFLYLDSYDYDEKDPFSAQRHCMNEVLAAQDKLSKKAIIMIDDCNVKGGGKGKVAIDYLLQNGWTRYRNAHQVILVRK
ncbi:MAG: hypothetical protein S4CHLAM102_06430 [Chlamydiia bacterium]|nr:hypothetical protein [Chlamydiia bacterium]